MTLENAKALVTGAKGFMGMHLVKRLQREGAEISAITRNGAIEGVKTYNGSITDAGFLKEVIKKERPAKIFHLAASLDKSFENLLDTININFNGTLNMLEALRGQGCSSFVLVSAAETYGYNDAPFREDMELFPISPYSMSKILAESACRHYHANFGIPAAIIKGFIVYGPGQEENMFIPSLISGLLKDSKFEMTKGGQTRDFVYIDDFMDALIKASSEPEASGEVINICSGEEHKLREVAEMALKIAGKGRLSFSKPYRINEQMRYFGDNSKAKKILGWKPRINLEEGLRKTVQSYKI